MIGIVCEITTQSILLEVHLEGVGIVHECRSGFGTSVEPGVKE
jgi:hypothetical protein